MKTGIIEKCDKKFTGRLSVSTAKSYINCPRQVYLGNVERVQRVKAEPENLGIAVHNFFESYTKYLYEKRILQDIDYGYSLIEKNKLQYDENGNILFILSSKDTYDKYVHLCEDFIKNFKVADLLSTEFPAYIEEKLAVDKDFAITSYDGPDALWRFRLDLAYIFLDKESSASYPIIKVIDYKTGFKSPDDLSKELQARAYAYIMARVIEDTKKNLSLIEDPEYFRSIDTHKKILNSIKKINVMFNYVSKYQKVECEFDFDDIIKHFPNELNDISNKIFNDSEWRANVSEDCPMCAVRFSCLDYIKTYSLDNMLSESSNYGVIQSHEEASDRIRKFLIYGAKLTEEKKLIKDYCSEYGNVTLQSGEMYGKREVYGQSISGEKVPEFLKKLNEHLSREQIYKNISLSKSLIEKMCRKSVLSKEDVLTFLDIYGEKKLLRTEYRLLKNDSEDLD